MPEKEKPNLYGILPAKVRYDKSLCPSARLLYAEITALCNKEGYCWASNAYFASLYEVNRSSITNWVKQLEEKGYIRLEYVHEEGKLNIKERKIYIAEHIEIPHKKQETDNEPEQQAETEGGQIFDQGGGELFDQGGQKTQERILYINNINLNSAAADLGDPEKPPPAAAPPGREAAATAPPSKKSENQTLRDPPKNAESTKPEAILALNRHFLELDSALIFDESFYPRALAYMELNGLDFGYATWLYEFCKTRKNLVNLTGFYYTIFCEPRYAELYHAASRPAPVVTVVCPVCGTFHGEQADPCPVCGLEKTSRLNQNEIEKQKWLYAMPQEVRAAYENECNKIYDGIASHNFQERNRQKNLLDEKYGRPGITGVKAEVLT